jgi:hypothetical protein
MANDQPERVWLRTNRESRFGVGAVCSPTQDGEFNIEYITITRYNEVCEAAEAACRLLDYASASCAVREAAIALRAALGKGVSRK